VITPIPVTTTLRGWLMVGGYERGKRGLWQTEFIPLDGIGKRAKRWKISAFRFLRKSEEARFSLGVAWGSSRRGEAVGVYDLYTRPAPLLRPKAWHKLAWGKARNERRPRLCKGGCQPQRGVTDCDWVVAPPWGFCSTHHNPGRRSGDARSLLCPGLACARPSA